MPKRDEPTAPQMLRWTGRRAERSERLAGAEFLDRGWQVFWPQGEDGTVDFFAYHNFARFAQRVQVKSGGGGKSTAITRRRDPSKKGRGVGGYLDYEPNDFDLLAIVDVLDDALYLLDYSTLCRQHRGKKPTPSSIPWRILLYHVASRWPGWKVGEEADAAFGEPATNGAKPSNNGQLDLFTEGFFDEDRP